MPFTTNNDEKNGTGNAAVSPLPRINLQKGNQAVTDSAKKFGSMINKNIIQPASEAANFLNPFSHTFQAGEDIKRTPQAMKTADAAYGNMVRSDLRQSAQRGKSPALPSPFNISPELAERANAPKPPPGNLNALNGVNQDAPPVNLAETATSLPGYTSPEAVNQLRQPAAPPAVLSPIEDKTNLVQQGPGVQAGRDLAGDIYNRDGEFNEENTLPYFEKTGYISDNDPRMVKRRAEAQEVQQRRLDFIGGKNRFDTLGSRKLDFNKGKFSQEHTLNRDKYNQADDIARQEQMNKSAKHDAEPANIVASDQFKEIFAEKNANKRAYLMQQLQSNTGYAYEDLMNYIQKTTKPKDDNDYSDL